MKQPTIIDKLQQQSFINKLNELVTRHTDFESWNDLVSTKHNYKPEMHIKNSLPLISKQEITELANYYDEYMRLNNDPRSVYRHS
jgi:hypothetical protein